jgi:DNA-binding HxlR family transcriptional regulator
MKGYSQFCPVAKAAEIVAERWTPLVLRELLCGSRRFSDLHRGVPMMSRTLLAGRLKELEDAGIVRSVARPRGRGREYDLTAAGKELQPLIECLGEWGQRWARAQLGRADLDPGLLMWDIHRRVNLEALPPERVVVRYIYRGLPATVRCPIPWWHVHVRRQVDRCLKDPGYRGDFVDSAYIRTLTRDWMGDVRMA